MSGDWGVVLITLGQLHKINSHIILAVYLFFLHFDSGYFFKLINIDINPLFSPLNSVFQLLDEPLHHVLLYSKPKIL